MFVAVNKALAAAGYRGSTTAVSFLCRLIGYICSVKKYFIKTPWWLKKLYPDRIWSMPPGEKDLYLTFDDGPHPEITSWVLQELKKADAVATFFCVGNNVANHPDIYNRILAEGHSTGNHTHTHLNGWKADDQAYLKDIAEAANYIQSDLFRPPYGRLTSFQEKNLAPVMKGKKPRVVMWDVLSADFDPDVTPEKALENVIFNAKPGSVVVLHDSEKAFPRLEFILPRLLQFFAGKGFSFRGL